MGLRGPLRTEVLEPFLAGVIADDGGSTSDTFARLLVRMFALGRPGVPERGIAALPAQLAGTARAAGVDIRLTHTVTRFGRGAEGFDVDVVGASALSARTIVVAVGPDAVANLAGIPAPPPRDCRRGGSAWTMTHQHPPCSPSTVDVPGRW